MQAAVLPNNNRTTLNSVFEIKDESFTFELDFTDNNSVDDKFNIDISDKNINSVNKLSAGIKIENVLEDSDFSSKSNCINLEKGDNTLTIKNINLPSINKVQNALRQTINKGVQKTKVSLIVNTSNSNLENISTEKQTESCKSSVDETNSKADNIIQASNNAFITDTILNTNSNSNIVPVCQKKTNLYSVSKAFYLNPDNSTPNKSLTTDTSQYKQLSKSAYLNINTNNNEHLSHNSDSNNSNIISNESSNNSKRRKIINSKIKSSELEHWNKQMLPVTGSEHSESEYTQQCVPSSREELTDEFIDIETHINRQQMLNLQNNYQTSKNVPQNRNIQIPNDPSSILDKRSVQHTVDLQNINIFLTMPTVGNHCSSVENSVRSRVAPIIRDVPCQTLNENPSRIQPVASNVEKPDNFFRNNVNPMIISNHNANTGFINENARCSFTGNLVNSHISGNKNWVRTVEKHGNISQVNNKQVCLYLLGNIGGYAEQPNTYNTFPRIISNPNPKALNSNINPNLDNRLRPSKKYLIDSSENHSNLNENQRSTNTQESNIGLSVSCPKNSVSKNQTSQRKLNKSCDNNAPTKEKVGSLALDDPHKFFDNIKSVSAYLNTEVDGILENDKEALIFSIDNIKSLFSCKRCDQRFDCFDNLLNHSKQHISDFHCNTVIYRTKYLQEESYVTFEITKDLDRCRECGMVFHRKRALMRHIWLHIAKVTVTETNRNAIYDPKKPYKCAYCDKTFGNDIRLQRHHQNVHQPKIQCEICKKMYSQKSLLTHKFIHKPKGFGCDVCGKKFNRPANLMAHKTLHTSNELETFDCDVCGEKFNRQAGLIEHKTVHTGKKPWPCRYCSKTFRLCIARKNHERVHTGERPYECEICKKCFTQRTSLQVHMRVHTGEKPYKCKDCGKCYTQCYVYKQHIKKHHSPSV